jgi:hypothetical protein
MLKRYLEVPIPPGFLERCPNHLPGELWTIALFRKVR